MDKKMTKLQTIIYKTLHTKQKIEQRATHKKSRVAKKDINLNKKINMANEFKPTFG